MNNHWIEKYTLRYGVGTIFGGAISWYLYTHWGYYLGFASWSFPDSSTVALLTAAGFAYCYIASAPLLVFHVARWFFLHDHIQSGLYLAAGVFVLMLLAYWSALLLFIYLLTLQIAAVAYCLSKRDLFFGFYRKIASARSGIASGSQRDSLVAQSRDTQGVIPPPKRKKRGAELIESYRDMREHGNACAILVLELLLAGIITRFAQGVHVGCVNMESATAIVAGLVIWLIPSWIVLYIAGTLEIDFSEEFEKEGP